VAAMERTAGVSVTVSMGVAGADVDRDRREGMRVTLRDGRVFVLDGSNDVNENNEGIFVLEEESGVDPEDPEARWIMVRWRDFRAVRFEEEGESSGAGEPPPNPSSSPGFRRIPSTLP